MINTTSTKTFNLLAVLFIALGVLVIYSNHYNNTFHFDDAHTIETNSYIRDLKNIPLFFKDATTFSTLPANQTYRPLFSTSIAIDYWMSGGLDPFWFHFTTIMHYVLQCILLYFILRKLFEKQLEFAYGKWFVLAASAWYAFHTANAETINYISARSDSHSALWILLSFFLFLYMPHQRKFGWYILPFLVALFYKQTVIVYPALLFLYVFFFESTEKDTVKNGINSLKKTATGFIIAVAFYVLQQKMTPANYLPGNTSLFNYLITQPYVILQYFTTFLFPVALSADTDLKAFDSVADTRFWIGIIFAVVFSAITLVCFYRKNLHPICFGLLWFIIALLPTSSLLPLAEVMNDHRVFFPFIGLAIAFGYALLLLYQTLLKTVQNKNALKFAAVLLFLAILTGNAFGAHQRNKVWTTEESLWKDVTIKSPKNGRGLMNYGLALMAKGDYQGAEKSFNKALEFSPQYSYLEVNLGVLKAATNRLKEAEEHFKKATQYGPFNPETYYYYGNFLRNNKRFADAEFNYLKTIELSPAHNARYELMQLYSDNSEWKKLTELAQKVLSTSPQDKFALFYLDASKNKKSKLDLAIEKANAEKTATNFINLSLAYYNEKKYEQCIEACNEALKLEPNNVYAYNNICSVYNEMGLWDEAEKACKKALEINPTLEIAKNNLILVNKRRDGLQQALTLIKKDASAENYLNLSLVYYNAGQYENCIKACETAIQKKANYTEAYNNICSAYNAMKQFEKAIIACEKAVAIDPNYQLAKNNLAYAKSQLK